MVGIKKGIYLTLDGGINQFYAACEFGTAFASNEISLLSESFKRKEEYLLEAGKVLLFWTLLAIRKNYRVQSFRDTMEVNKKPLLEISSDENLSRVKPSIQMNFIITIKQPVKESLAESSSKILKPECTVVKQFQANMEKGCQNLAVGVLPIPFMLNMEIADIPSKVLPALKWVLIRPFSAIVVIWRGLLVLKPAYRTELDGRNFAAGLLLNWPTFKSREVHNRVDCCSKIRQQEASQLYNLSCFAVKTRER
ncbi:hypothetical protein FRX31_019570 [Thalictrum thalictroides]|uniref:Uncharacterized protein n=1 Tax=Thalictrum thalictroides TaxID=46969 RepID=A0A7J6W178_THATH|nr:hypothetical protein FRX31_019570 [Thalictrum thalictroides]